MSYEKKKKEKKKRLDSTFFTWNCTLLECPRSDYSFLSGPENHPRQVYSKNSQIQFPRKRSLQMMKIRCYSSASLADSPSCRILSCVVPRFLKTLRTMAMEFKRKQKRKERKKEGKERARQFPKKLASAASFLARSILREPRPKAERLVHELHTSNGDTRRDFRSSKETLREHE